MQGALLVSHGFQVNYERGFCNGLSDAGASVTLVSSDRSDVSGLKPAVRALNLRGSQDENRPRWVKARTLIAYHLRLVALAVFERPVVHVFGLFQPLLLCGWIEGLIFRVCSRRYIVTAHNLLPHSRHTAWNRFAYGVAYRMAHNVVVHTPRMRDDLVRMHGVQPSRVIVMEHGIEPLLDAVPTAVPQEPGQPIRLLFFGIVAEYKGLDLLLDALARFPVPFKLTIAGGCWDAALEKQLRAAIAEHDAGSSIDWQCRYIPEEQVAGLFNNADALMLPYRHIDQSGVLFQAMRFGVPVVAARVGSFERYVDRSFGESFVPGSAPDLRRALMELQARLHEFDRVAIRASARRYEWQETVRVLLPLYGQEAEPPPVSLTAAG